MRALRLTALILACAAAPAVAHAQEAARSGPTAPFGGAEHDSTQPVEITSDALDLDQAAGTAVFTGTVRVAQGELRMAADRLEVYYVEGAEGSGGIERMVANGNVTLTNGVESAEAATARYVVATGIIDMQGDVLLTQGPNALSSEALRIDLNGGAAQLQGRVQTIFTPGSVEGSGGGAGAGAAP